MVGFINKRLPEIRFKRKAGVREWLLFILSIVSAAFFVWFGMRIIAFGDHVSAQELFALGVAQVVGGIIISGNEHHWYIGFTLVGVGFYSFARAAGIIKWPILGYLLAVGSWFAGALLIYITYPDTHRRAKG